MNRSSYSKGENTSFSEPQDAGIRRFNIQSPGTDSDPYSWGYPSLVALYCLLKKRSAMADSDTPGKKASAEFAEELLSGKALLGMSRTDRNPTPKDAQAMKAIQRIPASQIALIAASPAAEQLSKISHKQEMFPAAVAPSDEVRGEVRRVKIPDCLEGRNRT
ncbi:MAG TPA: hypothetical protein PKI68_03025 [Pontiellaceae bacterium]|nr:hypothetical protein [Pontiellaceae bacterium]